MNTCFRFSMRMAIVILVLAATGCATSPDAAHEHHKTAPAAQSGAKDEVKPSAGKMAMDTKAMCDMHHKMMAQKTAEEREAMMKEHMKNMSPQARQEKMEMMRNKCK